MMAAIYSAHSRAQTRIVESNSTAGVKLLRTGGGRCNITHTGTVDDFITVYADCGRFLSYCLHEFSPEAAVSFFNKNGLGTMIDENGCIFPGTQKAADVKRVLIEAVESLGAQFIFNSRVQMVEKDRSNGLFILQAPKEVIVAKALIIASGGVTWPQTGSAGDGLVFASTFGHTVIQPKASLVPLITKQTWIRRLAGVALEKVALKTEVHDRKIITVGPLIFTDNGIGGPAVLDFSRHITDYLSTDKSQPIPIAVDLAPDYQPEKLDNYIQQLCKEHPRREIPGILSEFLPRSIALRFCEEHGYVGKVSTSHLTRSDRVRLVDLLKSMPLNIESTRSLREAMVTRGGIDTAEIDSKTMASKLCEGLFFAGEIIDADGPCGGYNLQICWSTAVLAGSAAAEFAISQI